MKPSTLKHRIFIATLCILGIARQLSAQGTSFTYQGRLNEGGNGANGSYDLQFIIYDSTNVPGNIVAGPIVNSATMVTDGLFTVSLDPGVNAFSGGPRWLEIGVRTNGPGWFTTLAPRQQIFAAPYSITARNVTGSVAAEQLIGTIQPANIGAESITSVMLAPGSVVSNNLALGAIHSNHLAIGSIHSNHLSLGAIHSNHLAFGSIHSNHLSLRAIHSNHLALGSIHSNHLSLGAIHSNHLALGSIHSNHLTLGAIHSNHLSLGAIHSNHLALGSIHSNHLSLRAIHSNHLSLRAIHSNHLALGSIHSNHLTLGAIHSNHLALGSIHSNHLTLGAIHSNHLALGSIHSNHLTLGAIHSNHLALGSIHSNHLAVASVTSLSLADGSIHSNHLTAGSVSLDALSTAVSGSFSTTINHPSPGFFNYFGLAVAAVGTDKLLVGAYQDSTGADNGGAAYLLSTNGTLLRTFLSPAPQNQAHFGFAVAGVGQDKVLIGADADDTGALDAGTAYLFSTNGTLVTTFTNPTPAASDFFGYAVAAVGTDKVLIGAYADHFGANAGGAAYLFTTNRTLLTTFTNPTPTNGDRFGITVAAVGADKVLIGADRDDSGTNDSGVAYLFHINGALLATFNNPTPGSNDAFGFAVSAVGPDAVLIGARGDNSGGNTGGAAYLFNTGGTLLTTFTNPTPASGDQFGIAVAAVGEDKVLIGAASDDTGATDAGAAYLFSVNGTLLSTFNNPAPANGDLFGSALATVGTDKILIGAPQDDGGATDSGAAHLFALVNYLPGLALDPSIGVWVKSGLNIFYNGGKVGIGTASPQDTLQVSANNSHLRLHDTARGNYWHIYTENHPNPAISGNLLFFPGPSGTSGFIQKTTGNYFSSSDARLKKDVANLGGVLDRLLQLRPVSYRFNSAPESASPALGLIAQEVEPLFPEVVSEQNGMKALAYSELVPVTVGAIQELNQKLSNELKQKETQIAELRRRLEALERIISAPK